MKSDLPDTATLNSVLAVNGRIPGMCKHVLDSDWWFIDESSTVRTRVPSVLPSVPVTPARCNADPDAVLLERLVATARNDGWRVIDHADGTYIDLGGKRRAKAGLISVENRSSSLYVEITPDSCGPSQAVLAYVLHLTAFLRRVRASCLDFSGNQKLIWEASLDMEDVSEEHLIEALCCLADAVQHGQAEAWVIARDDIAAARWIEMNFPSETQTNKTTTNTTRPWSSTTTPSPLPPATLPDNAERHIRLPGVRL